MTIGHAARGIGQLRIGRPSMGRGRPGAAEGLGVLSARFGSVEVGKSRADGIAIVPIGMIADGRSRPWRLRERVGRPAGAIGKRMAHGRGRRQERRVGGRRRRLGRRHRWCKRHSLVWTQSF